MYIQGFVIPVPEGNQEKYLAAAEFMAGLFKEYGCTEIVEAWEDDVKDGTHTDFRKAECSARREDRILMGRMARPRNDEGCRGENDAG